MQDSGVQLIPATMSVKSSTVQEKDPEWESQE
jgi:hypothetical protein